MNERVVEIAGAAGQTGMTLMQTAGSTGSTIAIVAASITLAVVTIAVTLPKILNSIKSDRIDGNVLTRLQNLETKAVMQDAKIHRYAVRVTKLTVLVMRLNALIKDNDVNMPQDIVDDIVELTRETEEDSP